MAINAEDVMDAVQNVADGKFLKEHIKANSYPFYSEQELQDTIDNEEAMRAVVDFSYTKIVESATERFKPGWTFVNFTFDNPSGEPTTSGNPRYIFHDISGVTFKSVYREDPRNDRYIIESSWTILGEEK